ncbi:MAG: hypothetical protein P8Y23_04125 [Candidatus Lokiarchaeota archaeon]
MPIKVPQTEYEKIIATKVSESVIRIMGAMEKEPNLGDKYQLEINKLIYQLYKIKDEEKNYINSFLNLI